MVKIGDKVKLNFSALSTMTLPNGNEVSFIIEVPENRVRTVVEVNAYGQCKISGYPFWVDKSDIQKYYSKDSIAYYLHRRSDDENRG